MPRKKRTDWPPCEVNDNGNNIAIKAHIKSDDEMRALGFTDLNPTCWYLMRNLTRDISFNVTIDKDTEQVKIDVLDEMFLQPYDYQQILKTCPEHPYALDIYRQVELHMAQLAQAGIITGHIPGEYI